MPEPRFKVGDKVRIHKPGHFEHGFTATVGRVIPIEEYGGDAHRGPHAYESTGEGWCDEHGHGFFGALPDAMVDGVAEK